LFLICNSRIRKSMEISCGSSRGTETQVSRSSAL
jgi:hypothetical protein